MFNENRGIKRDGNLICKNIMFIVIKWILCVFLLNGVKYWNFLLNGNVSCFDVNILMIVWFFLFMIFESYYDMLWKE